MDEDEGTMGGKSVRAEARRQLGKQLRQDELAKRRGILPSASAASAFGDGIDDDAGALVL